MQERYSSGVTRLSQPPCMRGPWLLYGGETVDGDAAWDLFCAAADGHVPTIERLLAEDPRLVHAQHWYSIPLRFAVLGGHAKAVDVLLRAGSEPGMTEAHLYDWETFLQDSESRGFDEVHRVLLTEMQSRYGYEPNHDGFKSLCEAIKISDIDQAMQRLTDQPELVRISDWCGNTALHLAAIAGTKELVDACLDLGADIEAANYEAHTPFDMASGEMKRLLLKRGAVYDFYGACSLGDTPRVVELLLKEPGLAKRLYRSYNSPLMIASKGGHLDVVTLLLEHGAEPNLKEQQFDRGGALFEACANGHYEIVELLLESGADPNGPCESSGASIDHAATEEIAALLLERGSTGRWSEMSTDLKDLQMEIRKGRLGRGENGFDPIAAHVIWSGNSDLLTLYVEQFGTEPIAQLFPGSGPGGWFVPADGVGGEFLDQLIAAGFDINRPSWVGRTHLHFLASRNHCDTARRFVERGVELNVVSLESGTTPLGCAAQQGHQAMVEYLLGQGADPSIPHDHPKFQPHTLAEQRGHGEVAKLLC